MGVMGVTGVNAALDWLSELARTHAGAVPSWVNPDHPGYAYPEAAGLVLTTLAQARPEDPALVPLVAWLEAQVDAQGQVGRHGLGHTFDSAMVLTGLLAATRVGVPVDRGVLERLFDALVAAIDTRRAVGGDAPPRWSTTWSCHQLKLIWVLSAYDEEIGDPQAAARIEAPALDQLLDLQVEGRFQLSSTDSRSYVHASCYALEGVLGLRRWAQRRGAQVDGHERRLLAGGDWLVSIQASDGSLPCWIGAGEASERRPSDVLAQALRIWAAVDRERYAEPIAQAKAALARRQSSCGALSYLDGGGDHNSWCTAFAAQALAWAEAEADPGTWLV